jgi:cell division protein FtsA
MSGTIHRLDLTPMRPLPSSRATVVGVLDIGSDKIVCAVAKLRPRAEEDAADLRSHDITVLGMGHQRSAGIRSGMVMDLDAAERAIRRAVAAAETQSGVTLESVIVNVSCGRISSETFTAEVAISGAEVGESDIQRVLQAGRDFSLAEGRLVLHSLPIGYGLDGQRGIDYPAGMVGARLGVDMNIVTADAAPLRNIVLLLDRCHLAIEALVATPYASALGSLTADETRLGTACIDLGAGTTSVAVFFNNAFVFADAIAIGGQHVTLDIARGLSTTIAHAERLKTLHGSVISGESDEFDTVAVPGVGGGDQAELSYLPRSVLGDVIRPRVEEILELARDRLKRSGAYGLAGRRVVLAGGGSLLNGIVPLAERILDCRVRVARPQGVDLRGAAETPHFAGLLGLMVYPQVGRIEQFAPGQARLLTGTGGYFARVGRWLKDSF